ncbi:MAG: putative entry exclusion protein TrbK-alt [Hyphomonadaceae bacterium]
MDGKLLARLGAVALIAIAITVAVIEAARKPARPAPTVAAALEPEREADPLRQELRRCQALGAAAGDDRDCLAAWAENRRRFFRAGER